MWQPWTGPRRLWPELRSGAALMACGALLLALPGWGGVGTAPPASGSVARPVSAPADLMRFHVLANSDAPADQALKRAVRDAVLPLVQAAGRAAGSTTDVEARLRPLLPDLERQAQAVVRGWGRADAVRAELGSFTYDERVYGDWVVPAGTYRSLRLVIGAGAGRNWWCVVFPSVCLVSPGGRIEALPDPTTPAAAAVGLSAEQGVRILDERSAAELPVVPRSALLRWWRGWLGGVHPAPAANRLGTAATGGLFLDQGLRPAQGCHQHPQRPPAGRTDRCRNR